jgi:HEAT repeat protein
LRSKNYANWSQQTTDKRNIVMVRNSMNADGHIFLSYRGIEADFALQLAADLKNAGVNLWMDRFEIKPGEDWRGSIQQAINDCAAIIAAVSPDYVVSEYCLKELLRANDLKRPIFPVLLRSVEAKDWPFVIQGVQYVDFTNWRDEGAYRQHFDLLLKELRRKASGQIGQVPDAETRYLNSLIAELKAYWGVPEYVELSGKADMPVSDAEAVRPDPHESKMEAGLSLLVEQTESNAPGARRGAPPRDTPQKVPLKDIRQAIAQYPRFVLIGEPGAGKTTIIRSLAVNAARSRLENARTAPLPLFLRLPSWSDKLTIADFVRVQWRAAKLPEHIDPIGLLANEGAILYLDGLNEMGRKGAEKAKLLAQWFKAKDMPKQVIVTCRAEDYKGDFDLDLPTVLVEEMDEAQIRQFAMNYLEDKAEPFLKHILPEDKRTHEDARSLFRLARNPYLLTALIVVYKNAPDGDLPRNNGALMRALAQALWERERQRETPGWVSFEEMEKAFGRLAFAVTGYYLSLDISYEWALRQLTGTWWLRIRDNGKMRNLLQAAHSANLIELRNKRVYFYHQLIQEYFAAVELAQHGLHDHMKYGRWDEVAIAMCGIVPSADVVVSKALEINRPRLAAKCIVSGVEVSKPIRQETVTRFLEILGNEDSDADDVWTAAGVLRQLADANAVPQLVRIFRDRRNDSVRRAVARVLAAIGNTAAIHSLLTLLPTLLSSSRGYEYLIGSIVNALREIGKPAIPEILNSLLYLERDARCIAAWSLGVIGDPIAVPKLLEVLGRARGEPRPFLAVEFSPDHSDEKYWDLRIAAIWALGAIGDSAAIPGLVAALEDKDLLEVIRWATGRIYAPNTAEMFARLGDEQDGERRGAIFILVAIKDACLDEFYLRDLYLGSLDDRESPMQLAHYWPESGKTIEQSDIRIGNLLLDQIRAAVTQSLEKMGERTVSILLKALREEDRLVREIAIWGLVEKRELAAVPSLLETTLHDEVADLRHAAASGLGEIHDSTAIPGLLAALHDEEMIVRRATAWALGEIGDNRAVRGLLEALTDREVKDVAVKALAKIGDSSAVPGLLQVLRSGKPNREIKNALIKLGNADAVTGLLDALHDQVPEVRDAAAIILGKIGHTAIRGLLQALVDQDENVRQAAVYGLGVTRDESVIPELIRRLNDDTESRSIHDSIARVLLDSFDTHEATEAALAWQRSKDVQPGLAQPKRWRWKRRRGSGASGRPSI